MVHEGMVTNKGLSALPDLEHEAMGKVRSTAASSDPYMTSPKATQEVQELPREL